MDEIGIKGKALSHTQRMEKQTKTTEALTKANTAVEKVAISKREAIEYRDYKRQKKRAEIMSALSCSEGILETTEEVRRVGERAVRLRQAAVCLPSARLKEAGEYLLKNGVAMDCVGGGGGDTLAKVKAYEAKMAVRMRAKELTLVLSPYLIENCKYMEIRKEIRRVRRVARRTVLKVFVDARYPKERLAQMARIASESGAQFFCVPYFEGCERLRGDLIGGCRLQVSKVEDLPAFKRLINAGVGRIVSSHGWEIFSEWMKEIEKIDFPELTAPQKPSEPINAVKDSRVLLPPPTQEKKEEKKPINSETDYCCRLEGKDLKFL